MITKFSALYVGQIELDNVGLAGTPAERWVAMNPAGYQALAQRHRAGVTPA